MFFYLPWLSILVLIFYKFNNLKAEFLVIVRISYIGHRIGSRESVPEKSSFKRKMFPEFSQGFRESLLQWDAWIFPTSPQPFLPPRFLSISLAAAVGSYSVRILGLKLNYELLQIGLAHCGCLWVALIPMT